MIVIGDTSGLVAAFNTNDAEHHRAREALHAAAATVTSALVFAEIEHVIARNIDRHTAYAVNDWLLKQATIERVLVPEIGAESLRMARRIQVKYEALRLDLTDAVNVVLAERYETDTILTLDRRDFRSIRPLTGTKGFRLLPDDM